MWLQNGRGGGACEVLAPLKRGGGGGAEKVVAMLQKFLGSLCVVA